MSGPSDRELWQRGVAGDGDAFGALYDRHADAIYNYSFRRLADWAAAEDVTATVFLEAWRKRGRVVFTEDGAVLPWLYGVANNVVRNYTRGQRRFRRALAAAAGAPDSRPADQAERLDDEARMRAVLGAFDRLPAREREVLELCVFGDLSYQDAALALGVPIGTVRSRLSRARSRLRELVPPNGHGEEVEDGERSLARTSASALPRSRDPG